jgi:hypothetical protein
MPAQSKIALRAPGVDEIKTDTAPAWMIFLTPSLCNQFGGGMALHWVAA